MTWTPTEAIHLVSSEPAAGHVKMATLGLARHVRILGDRIALGPCDVDPIKHAELRRAWSADGLNRACNLDDLRVAVAGDLPVIVWASRAYEDLVWLWWVLDGLARLDCSATIVRLDSRRESVGGLPPEAGRAALRSAHAVSDDDLREASRLWRLFASQDPRGFDEARRSGSQVFHELSESAEIHGAWFPRLENRRLRLAEYDEALLSRLTTAWQTPGRIGISSSGWPFHGFEHVRRLREWAAHGGIERENSDPRNENPLEQDAFRCTHRTLALLSGGLESVGDAPSHYVGGCKLNDPARPWIVLTDGSGWRIVLMGVT